MIKREIGSLSNYPVGTKPSHSTRQRQKPIVSDQKDWPIAPPTKVLIQPLVQKTATDGAETLLSVSSATIIKILLLCNYAFTGFFFCL